MRIWIFRATVAFGNGRGQIIACPWTIRLVRLRRNENLSPCRGVYLTAGHQFPLGVTMSLKRRMPSQLGLAAGAPL